MPMFGRCRPTSSHAMPAPSHRRCRCQAAPVRTPPTDGRGQQAILHCVIDRPQVADQRQPPPGPWRDVAVVQTVEGRDPPRVTYRMVTRLWETCRSPLLSRMVSSPEGGASPMALVTGWPILATRRARMPLGRLTLNIRARHPVAKEQPAIFRRSNRKVPTPRPTEGRAQACYAARPRQRQRHLPGERPPCMSAVRAASEMNGYGRQHGQGGPTGSIRPGLEPKCLAIVWRQTVRGFSRRDIAGK